MRPTIEGGYRPPHPVETSIILISARSLLKRMQGTLVSIGTIQHAEKGEVWNPSKTEVTLEDWSALCKIMQARIAEMEERMIWLNRIMVKIYARYLESPPHHPAPGKLSLRIGNGPNESVQFLPYPLPDHLIVNALLQAEAIRAFEIEVGEMEQCIERSMFLSEIEEVRREMRVKLLYGKIKEIFPLNIPGKVPLFDRPDVFNPLDPRSAKIPNPWENSKPNPEYIFKME